MSYAAASAQPLFIARATVGDNAGSDDAPREPLLMQAAILASSGGASSARKRL
jgi:hypothetical protein